MPRCFQLFPKGENEPASLQEVDDKMREHFGAPPSDKEWFRGWYDTIGLGFALGHDAAKLKETFEDCEDLIEVLDYLEARYNVSAFYMPR